MSIRTKVLRQHALGGKCRLLATVVSRRPIRTQRQQGKGNIRAVLPGQTRRGGRKKMLTPYEEEQFRHCYKVLRPRMKQLWTYLEEGERVTLRDFQGEFSSTGLDPYLAESLFNSKPASFAPRRWVVAALADYYGISTRTVERHLAR